MAIAVVIDAPGGSQEVYERFTEAMFDGPFTEEKAPEGLILHFAGPTPGGWRVVDVWESEEAFGRFAQEKLMPAAEKLDFPAPEPDIFPVHILVQAQKARV